MGFAKKWSEKEIRIRLKNLEKIIPSDVIKNRVLLQMDFTRNEVDAMNLAYYSLKRNYSKVRADNFGTLNKIDYEKNGTLFDGDMRYWGNLLDNSITTQNDYSSTWEIISYYPIQYTTGQQSQFLF